MSPAEVAAFRGIEKTLREFRAGCMVARVRGMDGIEVADVVRLLDKMLGELERARATEGVTAPGGVA